MANQLTVQQAFAGVNYMEALGKMNAQTPFQNPDALLKPEDQGLLQHNVSSIMNKFTVFQYAPLNAGASYRAEGHFIGFTSNLKATSDYQTDSQAMALIKLTQLDKTLGSIGKSEQDRAKQVTERMKFYGSQDLVASAKRFVDNSSGILSNPTANRLIKWGAEISGGTPIGFQPYSHTDFMYCKHYGKIPNNRLITLRRYPFPIGDSLRISGAKRNAIPVAQAVTWFGGETSNTLNSLGVFNWDMPWESVNAVDGVTGQTIEGNEITFDEVLGLLDKIPKGAEIKAAIKAAYVGSIGNESQMQQISAFEAKAQKYQRNLYDQTSGPYWNRIYGPVNVITQSSRRKRGIQTGWETNPISLKFHYSFRSFNGMSPKIAALDIISNFMNLTYQDAQFLGQLSRYFPKLGLKFSPTVTEAISNILTNWGTTYTGNNSAEMGKIVANLIGAVKNAGSKFMSDPLGTGLNVLQTGLMSSDLLGKAIPEMISIKSALSDRPVGEWHIVVGNPMNPIFVMGDLLCTDVKMVWDDELGPDDFPTGVTFTVTLKQGKPRDKVSIERMLNHGQTKITAGALRTSASSDTFGTENNEIYKATTDSESSNKALEEAFNNLSSPNSKDTYVRFRNRFLAGYGFPAPTKNGYGNQASGLGSDAVIDDRLLLLYYQRQYGNN